MEKFARNCGRYLAAQRRNFSASRQLRAVKPFLLADVGEGIKECEVVQWYVQPNARVDEFDPICEVQSDKATVEITSRFSGVIKTLHYEVGQMAQVGSPLLDIDADEAKGVAGVHHVENVDDSEQVTPPETEHASADTVTADEVASIEVGNNSHAKALATPAVRRLCREYDLDIGTITGTGKGHRVMKEDVLKMLSESQSQPAASTQPSVESEVQPLKGVAKQMFMAMQKSASIPHFLYTEEIEMDRLVGLRSRINKVQPQKLSYMPFMIKALSLALLKYPMANSRLLADQEAIEHRREHNISIAMDTPNGLVVPCIKSCNTKSILEIAAELTRLQQAGSQGRLEAADLRGGTITLSNIGSTGGMYVAPVIVDSQVCIGGIGRIRKLPRFDDDGNVIAKSIMCCSWAGDHRVLDGMTVALLVSRWKQLLEHPDEMLIEMR